MKLSPAAGRVANPLTPETQDALTMVPSDHMVAGSLISLDLKQQIKVGNRQRN